MMKKQQAAIGRILNRESKDYEWRRNRSGVTCGLHPCGDGYIVTDGSIAVYFPDKPDGFPDGDRMDIVCNVLINACRNGNHTRVEGELPIAEWKEMNSRARKTGTNACVDVCSSQEYGFDPRLLLDAVDIIGKNSVFYIGHSDSSSYPTILVFPEDEVADVGCCQFAYILPCRKMEN